MGSNFEPKMAERTSNSTFNLEACLRTMMEKLDHTIMVSETALKMAQEIQQKISEPESRAPTFDNHQRSNDSKSTEDPEEKERNHLRPRKGSPRLHQEKIRPCWLTRWKLWSGP